MVNVAAQSCPDELVGTKYNSLYSLMQRSNCCRPKVLVLNYHKCLLFNEEAQVSLTHHHWLLCQFKNVHFLFLIMCLNRDLTLIPSKKKSISGSNFTQCNNLQPWAVFCISYPIDIWLIGLGSHIYNSYSK